jgi:HTH-type transcriptional regulator, competence development regulator
VLAIGAKSQDRGVVVPTGSARPNMLGAFIRKARQDVAMSLRDVEEATKKEVSNGYLSQLESGKIARPSPQVLYALSEALSVNYEALMQRAGYILPNASRRVSKRQGRAGTFTIDNLTGEEEAELLKYLTFLRTQKK